jgi:hypothetical protein
MRYPSSNVTVSLVQIDEHGDDYQNPSLLHGHQSSFREYMYQGCMGKTLIHLPASSISLF